MIAMLILAAAAALPAPQPTPQSLRTVVLYAPKAAIRVQVAQTEPQRELGLMWVRRLPQHTGMLFDFGRDAGQGFWMKDTLVPLDMVFVGENGRVTSVAADVPVVPLDTPNDRIPTRTGYGAYVIELPAGEARADGIRAGTRIGGLPLRT